MRRADRLFQLIQALRRRPVVTAAALARELEVSERTIYRDIRDLVASGVPIDGEAGVGYTLRKGFDLPPLMFRTEEVEALVFGARMVASWGGDSLAASASTALERLEAALPPHLRAAVTENRLFAPRFHVPVEATDALSVFRTAIRERRRVQMGYIDANGVRSDRAVRPLGLFFWGRVWTVGAWCELRNDFRGFRLDRAQAPELLPFTFADEPGRTLDDFFRAMDDEESDDTARS